MKISVRSTDVLTILGLLSIAFMVWVEATKKQTRQPHFEEKLASAERMYKSIEYLKEKHFKNEISIDNINDPNDTKIIGTQFSEITSGKGSLPIKLSTVNPNVAALVVELFKEAELEKGDHIAICFTGSFPALNIAALSAADVLGLQVSIIGSVTSSSWGANDPLYTYLDMHSTLIEGELLSQKILASSIGANEDIGRTLSGEGRELALQAITRNKIEVINGNTLKENIKRRMEIFKDQEERSNNKIKVFVNIGGGIASMGSDLNSDKIPPGYLGEMKLNDFPDKRGVIFEMAAKEMKIINLLNLEPLFKKYNLPIDPVPLPEAGSGELFYKLKYDYRYVIISLSVLALTLLAIILYDKKQNKLGKNIIYGSNEETNSFSDSL